MPTTRTTTQVLRGRRAVITTAAYAEVLFVEGQDIPRWQRRFSRKISQFAKEAAPGHNYAERPLRPHAGVPLKQQFTATTQPNPALMRVDSAIGNKAPYSAFVDQGTGIFNPQGGSPYVAKVLPPWAKGEGSLYEAAWTPGKKQVSPVMIQGQRGQGFMAEGLNRAFLFMMRSGAQPSSNSPKAGPALALFPENLALRGAGNTPNDAAFQANIREWRKWRDEAFRNGDQLGRGQRKGRSRESVVGYQKAAARARADNASTRAAAAARAAAQIAALRNERDRKAEGERKRRERDRRERARDAQAEGTKFERGLNKRGIKSRGSFSTNPKTGRPAYRVVWRQGGVERTRYFPVYGG